MTFANNATTQTAILALSSTHDSFYLYGQADISRAASSLCASFPDVTFLYSLKNNPCAQILQTLTAHGFGADAASLGEVLQSATAGIAKEKIQYSAPGKTDRDIAAALPHATLIADSLNEVQRIERIAAAQGVIAEIGVRIHPSFAFDGEAVPPSKFGIEEAQAFAALPEWRTLRNIRVVGLHIHCHSQSLSIAHLQRYHANVLACANRFAAALGAPLRFVNMGAGFGIPYAPEDTALDLAAIATETNAQLAQFHAVHPSTHVYIETGRYCVGNNGVYATKVLDKKTCGGKTFVILANTLNGFIRPSLAQMLEAATPTPAAAEPMYTALHAFAIYALPQPDAAAQTTASATSANEVHRADTAPQQASTQASATTQTETVTLVGNLCTATDVLASDITLPALNIGDMVVVTNAGSYAAVLSPMQFSSQVPPAQLMLREDGSVVCATDV